MEASVPNSLVRFRPYQQPVFTDRTTGILVLHWARQIGKSFTLAAWAVDRLLTKLPWHPSWLVTVLSNSRDNGAEFVRKCAEICQMLGLAAGQVEGQAGPRRPVDAASRFVCEDASPDLDFANMRMEVRIGLGPALLRASAGPGAGQELPAAAAARGGRVGRIKVLAANPRTARGFSGDLILDEFAFHEDSEAIWTAAEPILSANPEFLCRVASTGNGRFNLFYRMVTSGRFKVSRVSRTAAWEQGVSLYDPHTRQPVTPAEARAQALDQRAYDQNYELSFADENSPLLTLELIGAAERASARAAAPAGGPVTVDEQAWSAASLARMAQAAEPLYVGHDIGRERDWSVVTVLTRAGATHRVVGMLRMRGLRLPAQQIQLAQVCALPRFAVYAGDMSGLGLGLVEYLQEQFGQSRIRGVNFAHTEPLTPRLAGDGRRGETARVTEIMATELLALFEDRALELPVDQQLREDLRKPEKVVTPGGRVSIAATRDAAGHADHFWSLALAVRAASQAAGNGLCRPFPSRYGRALAARRERVVA